MKKKHLVREAPGDRLSDKRIFKRRQLICYLELFNDTGENRIGHVVDISLEGMLVMSEKPFAMHQPYGFSIAFKKPSCPRQMLRINARSKWCRRGMNANYYDTGFELVGLEPTTVEALEYIMEAMCF